MGSSSPASKTRRGRPSPRAPGPAPRIEAQSVGDLLRRLGGVPPDRVRLCPPPGTATERDVVAILDRENRLFELVEGTLVEKPMGHEESAIAGLVLTALNNHVRPRKLGIVTGPDGTIRLYAGLVRIPDVAFASWRHFPNRKLPRKPIPDLAPDLVVEVLSRSNTPAEMGRKLGEYFQAGVRLVWVVDPRKRSVRVHTAIDRSTVFQAGQSLDGGDVLPGFALPADDIFPFDENP